MSVWRGGGGGGGVSRGVELEGESSGDKVNSARVTESTQHTLRARGSCSVVYQLCIKCMCGVFGERAREEN